MNFDFQKASLNKPTLKYQKRAHFRTPKVNKVDLNVNLPDVQAAGFSNSVANSSEAKMPYVQLNEFESKLPEVHLNSVFKREHKVHLPSINSFSFKTKLPEI